MRVVAALSGGVDSSVAALRLKRRGHEVVGLFMRLAEGGGSCCNLRSGKAARRVADRLSINFAAVDYATAFHDAVVAPSLAALAAGLTPNPCVACNGEVKFGPLLDQARRLGATALATGHYARRRRGRGGLELHEAACREKDQTYFLWPIRRASLEHLRFPLGQATSKRAVRNLARWAGLPTAETPESQDLCFAPAGLAALMPEEPGDVLDASGSVVGRHRGQHTVTLGQRRGLGVALGEPVFVVDKDASANTVTVGRRDLPGRVEVPLAEANWLARPPGMEEGVEARVRHRGPRLPLAEAVEGSLRFRDPVVVAPGQSVAVYRGTRMLGGGVAR